MKTNKVNASVETMEAINESKQTKGFKVANAQTSQAQRPKLPETKSAFISFIRNKEEIGLNKFFKLLQGFKEENPNGYADFLASANLDFATEYTFKWFSANCPTMEINGKKEFAKWVKVTEKYPLNENEEYNRVTEKGVSQTLKPYFCVRANYEQYLSMFMDVIREMKRKKRIAEKEAKEKEKEANAEKQVKAKADRIAKLQAELAKLQAN